MSDEPQLRSFPLLDQIVKHARSAPTHTAVTDFPVDEIITYQDLLGDVINLAIELLQHRRGDARDLDEMRVAVLCNKGYLVPLAMLATWTAGGVSLPILPSLPLPEQSYLVENSEASMIICDATNRKRVEELSKTLEMPISIMELSLEQVKTKREPSTHVDSGLAKLRPIDGERRAMMLYTSGTTGRPKGVVTRHSALASQVSALVDAWRWTSTNKVQDNLLHVLPLNHLHGITVALLPTLWAGASVEMWDKLDGPAVWRRWINKDGRPPITMFFGVPTVYSRLISAHSALPEEVQKVASNASSKLRLQVSGSAPLPESVKSSWEVEGGIGGGMILLERYGMTETGIIAGTGWEDSKRIKGHIGWPLANVQLRLWNEEKSQVVQDEEVQGEVQVHGPGIFNEYWRLPEVTKKEFQDGWFKTGDVAVYSSDSTAKGQLRILGRKSTDIIKSGGEKISAIEIERVILELEGMKDVAVVGVEDEEWGQVVGVCLVTTRNDVTVDDLRKELRPIVAAYKLPRRLKLFEAEIPRNNMGKVNKKQLVIDAFP